MRKFTFFTLILVLAFALTACGRRNETQSETAPSATQEETEQVTLPTIDPTMGTNIPDPEVDTSMPDVMDPNGGSNDANGGSSGSNGGSSGNTGGSNSTGSNGGSGKSSGNTGTGN